MLGYKKNDSFSLLLIHSVNTKILQMLTSSIERFLKIQKEAPVDCQKYLVQVTKYQAAASCKVMNKYHMQYVHFL